MKNFGSNSEYGKLTSILLHKPGVEIDNYPDPSKILHLRSIDQHAIESEFDAAVKLFKSLGVEVNMIDPTPLDGDIGYLYNMMYCRDLFFMTPHGAIMANMANDIRVGEPLYAEHSLRKLGVPILHTVSGSGRFEGADALWLKEDVVVVGVGNRTNTDGYSQIRAILAKQGVECLSVQSSQMVTQHLLGSIQIVDTSLALVRHAIIAPEIISFLEWHGFTVVNIPDNPEVSTRQAMNIVTVAPRTIIMTDGCPETKMLYQKSGLNVVAELELTQLINGAGGLACATSVIGRTV
ncbi:MAG: arginine deiminase family protein [Desulfuromonadaceae bacterium]|nr:arginine deiminase family protein [Desulfuromonadaceae bacterium]MDD2854341.1 arginine deiminase family protein [Desulfuromonadaceae bacterium]